MEKDFVRLTPIEWQQLKALPLHSVFCHVNLEHSGPPHFQIGTQTPCIKICKPGSVSKDHEIKPELDYSELILVRLLNLYPSRKIKNLEVPTSPPWLLQNPIGILESLIDRYQNVRYLQPDQIIEMNCFIREFIKL